LTAEGRPRPDGSQRQYWSFYWPLLLWSVSMVAARQFENAALAHFDPRGTEIAIFAYATSVYWLSLAMLAFAPQVANALGRSKRSRHVCLIFTAVVCTVLTVPLLFLGLTPLGRALLARALGIKEPAVLEQVGLYLTLLSPLILLNGLRHYYTGLLVQARRTGIVAVLNVLHVPLVVAMLGTGIFLGWRPVPTIVLAQGVPLAAQLIAAWACYRKAYRPPVEPEKEPVTFSKALAFFWPVALTGLMFAFTRPIIYAFVNRLAVTDPKPIVAALRVGFDLAMLFQMASNQFRHVFVTFGSKHLPGLRKFMFRVVVTVTTLMLIVALTPLKTLFFGNVLGLEAQVRDYAGWVLLVMCAVPTVIAWRNYYHGLALIHHRTVGMSIGGLARNSTALLLSWGLLSAGWLGHSAPAAAVLVCAFTAEAIAVILSTWSWRRKLSEEPPADPPLARFRT
jgi:Na+-driven multidrug efflux pump